MDPLFKFVEYLGLSGLFVFLFVCFFGGSISFD